MKIFLIGLPGCGKSTLGKELAQTLSLPFVDLDIEIEKITGRQVAEIFKSSGEIHFRKMEEDELLKWCGSEGDFVMATGGGTPCFFDNMIEINRAGVSVFMDVPVDEIARRMLKTILHSRPLLSGNDEASIAKRVQAMRNERIHVYNRAHHTISSSNPTTHDVRSAIDAIED
jgi:shikimate kinase